MNNWWIIVGCCLLVHISMGCPTYRNFDYSDCDFFMTYTDTSCTNFNFTLCQWTQCSTYTSYYDNEGRYRTRCSAYTTRQDPNWYGCTIRCCNPEAVYPQTTQGLEDCQAWLTAQFKRALILGLSITFGILGAFAIFITILCCCLGKCDSCLQSCKDRCCDCDCSRENCMYYLTCRCLRRSRPVGDFTPNKTGQSFSLDQFPKKMESKEEFS